MIKIKANNTTELMNCLYGDDEDYSYIKERDISIIINEHQIVLRKIYKKLEEIGFKKLDIYMLGDTINLLELFKNIEIK